MSQPDQHPLLIAMGSGEPTCDACMYDLFPQAPDTICDDCKLNPLKDNASRGKFIIEAAKREFSLPLDESTVRRMLSD